MSATLQKDAPPTAAAANGRRPGFSGLRPLLYQLISYSVIAAVNAVLSMTLINAIVFYREIDGGWRLIGAAAATALVALVNSYVMGSALTFRSSALFRGQLFARSLIVNLAGVAMQVGIFAAVALTLLARTDAGPNEASTIAEAGALAATFVAVFVGLRQWAYRPEPARAQERPLLAAGGWVSVANLDPELTTIAAGERHLRALWRARYPLAAYGGVLGLLLAFGWYSSAYLGMNNFDGTARVHQAFSSVFSRDPHLAAIGLTWPPLPVLTDIPLVVLLRPFGQVFLAGSVMGAIYASGAVVMMYYVAREAGAGRILALMLAVALLTHQHIYQSAAAGLSEAPFAMFLLASLFGYLRWMRTGGPGALTLAGLMGAAAAMCRYEGVLFVLVMAVGVYALTRGALPLLPWFRSETAPRRETGAPGATLLAFLSPFAFVMTLWMWFNLQIMGNPLYFLFGVGSTVRAPDTARIEGPTHALWSAYESVSGALELGIEQTLFLSPLIVVSSVALLLYAVWRRNVDALTLVAVGWAIIAFQILTAYRGTLPPWVRYWYWAVPMGFTLAAYGVGRVRAPGVRSLATLVVVVLAFVPNMRVFIDTYDHFPGDRDERVRNALLTTPDLRAVDTRVALVDEYRRVATMVDENVPPGALVLLDVLGPGGAVPLFIDDPRKLVITTDRDFESDFLSDARASVDYVLVPFPSFDNLVRSVVLQTYEGIWEGDQDWLELAAEDDGYNRWRLYRVLQARPAAANQ